MLTTHRSGSPRRGPPGELVALDRAGDARGAGQPAPVVAAGGRHRGGRARSGRAATRSGPCRRPRAGRRRRRSPWPGRTCGTRTSAARRPRRRPRADRPGRSRPAASTPRPPAPEEAGRCGGTGPPCPPPSADAAVAPWLGGRREGSGPSAGTLTSASACTGGPRWCRSAARGEGEPRPDRELADPLEGPHPGRGRRQGDRGVAGRGDVLRRGLEPGLAAGRPRGVRPRRRRTRTRSVPVRVFGVPSRRP